MNQSHFDIILCICNTLDSSLTEEKMANHNTSVIYAAGGNPTGIIHFDDDSHRSKYAEIAKAEMAKNDKLEQFGFVEGTNHFQMSGGEFCGNGARAAALFIYQLTGKSSGSFTMSGYSGTVRYNVGRDSLVRCEFPNFKVKVSDVNVLNVTAKLIDMGGIVHVVLPESVKFVNDKQVYQQIHRDIVEQLGLSDREAVGVVWQEKMGSGIKIHPVVWVKGISSFFYETSCGSGTLASLIAGSDSHNNIYQPSGYSIYAEKKGNDTLILESDMSVVE